MADVAFENVSKEFPGGTFAVDDLHRWGIGDGEFLSWSWRRPAAGMIDRAAADRRPGESDGCDVRSWIGRRNGQRGLGAGPGHRDGVPGITRCTRT